MKYLLACIMLCLITDTTVAATPLPSKGVIFYSISTESVSKKEFDCLVKNIYHEAQVTLAAGLSVAQITFNRLKTGKWGKSVCSVVYAPNQFSWTLTSADRLKKEKVRWENAVKAAKLFLSGKRIKGLEQSLYYHSTRLRNVSWSKKLKTAHVIGGHVFYINS